MTAATSVSVHEGSRDEGGALLRLVDASKRHGAGPAAVPALSGASLSVAAGELVAVVGASGSGKTTLLTLAGGLDRPDGGQVVVAGADLARLRPEELYRHRRRHIGFVFQDLNLLRGLTAAENVSLPLELDDQPRRRCRELALQALEQVGLADLRDRLPDQLSGGQQQRVALARAVVGERRLVLADEPTGALDSVTAAGVLDLLRARVDGGAACVLVTHDLRSSSWADRVVTMSDGRIVAER